MKQVSRITLAPDGPELSRIAVGMWRLLDWAERGPDLAYRVEECLDLGVTTFDHADIYGDGACETIFGEAIAGVSGLRDRLEIVTKCGIVPAAGDRVKHYDTSEAHIIASVERSLRNLRTDHVDLFLLHRSDPLLDPDDVAEAFGALWRSGKVLHFGVSNHEPAKFDLLASRLETPLVTNQIEFSVMETKALRDGTLDHCQRQRISPMAWSPLARGRLFSEECDQARRLRDVLGRIGEAVGGYSVEQVALAWVLQHPSRPQPLLGTSRLVRVEAAVEAESIQLSREQWFSVLRASVGADVP